MIPDQKSTLVRARSSIEASQPPADLPRATTGLLGLGGLDPEAIRFDIEENALNFQPKK